VTDTAQLHILRYLHLIGLDPTYSVPTPRLHVSHHFLLYYLLLLLITTTTPAYSGHNLAPMAPIPMNGKPNPFHGDPLAWLQPSCADPRFPPYADNHVEVQVILTLEGGEDSLTDRFITFKSSGGSIQVGRASKTERKQLVPAVDNMWISNPVISRYHAMLSVEKDEYNVSTFLLEDGTIVDSLQTPLVFLEDNRSSHGTFVNGNDIKQKGKRQLINGDEVQFGDKVLRCQGTRDYLVGYWGHGADRILTEEFDPPVFKVQIKKILNELIQQLSSTGRSISVPDDMTDDSEMDESESEVESTGSHSSPPQWEEEKPVEVTTVPGSVNNPFTVEEEVLHERIAIDLTSREASEEYEPMPNVPAAARSTFDFDVGEEEVEFDIAEPTHDESEAEGAQWSEEDNDDDAIPAMPQSPPAYMPTSPDWSSQREAEFVPQHSIHLPRMAIPALPLLQSTNSPNIYHDGPFSQLPVYHDEMVSFLRPSYQDFISLEADMMQDAIDIGAPQEEERVTWSASLPTYTAPEVQSTRNVSSVTVSTQELLETTRASTSKNDMSIKSIINPPTTTSRKRKANEISDDEHEVELAELQSAPKAVTVSTVREDIDDTLSKEVEAKIKLPVAAKVELRPKKRLRSVASHVGTFVAGGVSTLLGLAFLPDNFFG
jgi:hypothetical protein